MVSTISHSSFIPYPKFPNSQNYPSQILTLRFKNQRIICCLSLNQVNENAQADKNTGAGLRVLFAAGGTGGHIYPAVAIADELKTIHPNADILFIGTPNGMESTAVPSAGYSFSSVNAVPLFRPILSPQNLFIFPYLLIKSLIESWRKVNDFNPQIVVGTGGYVSFPVCLVSVLKGIKVVIQEQNSVPGIANWILSFLADKIFVAFNSTVESFPKHKCVVCGNPVRLSLLLYVSKAVARMQFFPRAAKTGEAEAKVVLILGGSLGANAINIALLYMYNKMLSKRSDLFIIWQTGVEAFVEMESLVKTHPRLILSPFLHSMDLAYAAADLIISRAGAMTCCEILATGKPSILIPSPNVAEGHQVKNAFLMADLAGSRVILEDELDSTTLGNTIEEILENESLMAEMSERALKAAKPNATAEIAQHILSLVMLSTAEK